MAKIKLSAIGITNISGKSGGSVFAHNKNGNYVRRLGIPTQPNTHSQTLVRSVFGALARSWNQLNESARNAWKDYGLANPKVDQFGDSRPLTGRQAYISANSNLHTAGKSFITNPDILTYEMPSVIALSGIVSWDIQDKEVASAIIEASLSGAEAGISYVLSVAVVSKGADFGTAKNKYRQIATGVSTSLDTLSIAAQLNGLGVNPSNNVYIKVEFVTPDGKRSNSVTALMSLNEV